MTVPTIYISNELDKSIPYKIAYDCVIDKFSTFCNYLKYEHDDRCVTYKDTKIEYRLVYQSQLKRYFLNFKPENVWTFARKQELTIAFDNTIEFFNILNEELDFELLKFRKVETSAQIDVNEWTFTTIPDLEYYQLKDLSWANIRKIGNEFYTRYKGKIDQKLIAINGTGTLDQPKFNNLLNKVSFLFIDQKVQVIKRSDYTLEEISVRGDLNKLFILYFGNDETFGKDYKKYKQYLISNEIPSQFANVKNYKNTIGYGFDNLVFEILKKSFKEDMIFLDPPSFVDVDGFLCLSDIGNTSENQLFGISVTLRGHGYTDDWLEIYNDIIFDSDDWSIKFDVEDISKLSQKIDALSNLKNKTIDVYVTKRWRIRDVGKLVNFLSENDINVRRFLYISNKTNRFLFSNLKNEDSSNLNIHPYIIWDGKVASIQTNSVLQLYGTMFPIHIELLNHWTAEKLNEKDMQMIIWMVKKRIYRINNFYNIRTPEIMKIFDGVKEMELSSITNKMRISTHLII